MNSFLKLMSAAAGVLAGGQQMLCYCMHIDQRRIRSKDWWLKQHVQQLSAALQPRNPCVEREKVPPKMRSMFNVSHSLSM